MRLHLASWLAVGLISAPAIAYNSWSPFHHAVNLAIAEHFAIGTEKAGISHLNSFSERGVKVGDTIGRFEVSSGFGKRVKPCPDCSEQHNGIDIKTPIGTPVYAPASEKNKQTVRVRCYETQTPAGVVALLNMDAYPGVTVKLFHLNDCREGTHREGSIISTSGNTGRSTGPHLHVEQITRLGKHRDPSAGLLSWLITGQPPTSPEKIELAILSDEDLICSIGAAEGTRNPSDCRKTRAYRGHTDPGNSAWNQGTFSYQHQAKDPAAADRKQLARLRAVEQQVLAFTAKKGVTLSKLEMLSILDQFNQAPEAALGAGGTLERIVEARAQSYVDPATNQLNAPGLGNDMTLIERDQRRRTTAIIRSLNFRQQQRSVFPE